MVAFHVASCARAAHLFSAPRLLRLLDERAVIMSDDRHREFWSSPRLEWLNVLPEPERDTIRGCSERKVVEPRAFVFQPDSAPSSLYFVETGLVRLYRSSPNGDEVTLGFVREGEVLGELPFLVGGSRKSHAQAIRPSIVWRTPHDVVGRVVATHPELVLAITRQLASRLRRVEDRVEELVFQDARSRLVRVLFELAEDFGHHEGSTIALDLALTQEELATMVGNTRQTLNTELQALVHAGLLTMTEKRITLLDLPRLRALSARTRER